MITTICTLIFQYKIALMLSAGSAEEAKLYENYMDEEIKDKVLNHCKCWGITECEIVEA